MLHLTDISTQDAEADQPFDGAQGFCTCGWEAGWHFSDGSLAEARDDTRNHMLDVTQTAEPCAYPNTDPYGEHDHRDCQDANTAD